MLTISSTASTTNTQRWAARLMIATCAVITLGVAAAAIAQARTRSDRPTVVFAAVPAVAASVESSTSSIELIHDATPAAPANAAPVALSHSAAPHKTIRMIVTAYCPCAKCCGASAHGVTASGKPVSYHDGRFVAADTHVLPFGTKLSIPGYDAGKAVEVIDTGGAINGNRLDVFFPTHKEALQWGRRTIDVEVE
jgi:3D (Asp-Asp-Asp) domain-containing protein